jgi:hypothetical protein
MVYNLSYRKFIGPLGFICFGSVIILAYKYLITYKLIYALCDLAAIGLSVFLLFPFFRNQVVEIVGDSIIVYNFGKKCTLNIDNLQMIRLGKDGTTSYLFSKAGKYYYVIPNIYTDSETMLKEFTRIFDSRHKEPGTNHE